MPASSGSRAGSTRVLKGGPSKLRGVIWHKSNGKWEARIYETGKQRFLGYYTSEVAAARAYDARAVQLHGSAAKVNFPEDYNETRGNPPAVKAFSALTVPHLSQKRRAASRGASIHSAATRACRRADDGTDEDYVLPQQTRTRRSSAYNMRPPSSRRVGMAMYKDEPEVSLFDDDDDETSLEQGAVEVLATLLSGSDDSRRSSSGSATKWNVFGEARPSRASSPPTASTGASPAPPPKSKAWVPPLWMAQEEGQGPSELTSRPLRTLEQARAQADLEEADQLGEGCQPLETVEDCVESRQAGAPCRSPASHKEESSDNSEEAQWKARGPDTERSCTYKGITSNPGNSRWTASDWDAEASKDRHMGNFESGIPAAYAYDQEAAQMHHRASTLNFPESHHSLAPRQGPMITTAQSTALPTLPRTSQASQRLTGGQSNSTAVKPTRGSSRFRGVSWCEKGQKWRALLWDGNRQHFLGHFKSEEEGARAYDRALLQRKKKDGCLNFPISDYQQPASGNLPTSGGRKRPRESAEIEIMPASTALHATNQDTIGSEGERLGAAQPTEGLQAASRFKGVSWSARTGKWKAQMWLGSRIVGLGYFDDDITAARAYDVAVREHRGPYAETNFPSISKAAELGMATVACRAQGVRFHMNIGKWEAQIFNGVRQISLGYYDSEAQALGAFNAAVMQLKRASQTYSPAPAGWNSQIPLTAMAASAHASAKLPAGWGSQKRRCFGASAPCN